MEKNCNKMKMDLKKNQDFLSIDMKIKYIIWL